MTGVRAAKSDEPPTKFEVGKARRIARMFDRAYPKLLTIVVMYTGPDIKEHACVMYGERAPNANCLKPNTETRWLVED